VRVKGLNKVVVALGRVDEAAGARQEEELAVQWQSLAAHTHRGEAGKLCRAITEGELSEDDLVQTVEFASEMGRELNVAELRRRPEEGVGTEGSRDALEDSLSRVGWRHDWADAPAEALRRVYPHMVQRRMLSDHALRQRIMDGGSPPALLDVDGEVVDYRTPLSPPPGGHPEFWPEDYLARVRPVQPASEPAMEELAACQCPAGERAETSDTPAASGEAAGAAMEE
jgi:hypothetical protein